MSVAHFVKGALVEIDQRPHALLREIDKGIWSVEDQRSGRIKEFTHQELLRLFSSQRLLFINDRESHLGQQEAEAIRKRDEVAMAALGSAELARIRNLRAYVKAVENLPGSRKLVDPAIRQVWENLGREGQPPHFCTVMRWKKEYIRNGKNVLCLRVKHERKGNRSRRYEKELLRFVEEAVERVYMSRTPGKLTDVLDAAIVEVERENKHRPESMQLPLPTARLVRRHIDDIDAFDRYAARYGRLAAVRKYRTVLNKVLTDRPLECAEMDHTQLDLMVVDEETGMPWGRPWITVCIDRRTRCILGIYISFEPPSYLTVARCLKFCFMPKVDLKERFPGIDNEWLAYGVPETLVVDNGLEFHSDSLELACFALGIDLQFTPRKTPWFKGAIERFLGTMNRGISHGTPGTTFASILEKGDYDPAKHAVISLETLTFLLHKWIADVYHQKPHRSLDLASPASVWAECIDPEDIPLPENPACLDAMLGRAESRTLTHKGIELEGLFYNSPDLGNLRSRMGDKLKVELRLDEGNLGHIHVIAPDNSEYFRVPCIDQGYAAGLSRWQHSVCKRYARLHLDLGDNPNAWRHAKQEISDIIRNEMFGKRKKVNGKAARFATHGIAADQPPIVTGIEAAAPADKVAAALQPAAVAPAAPRKFSAKIESRNQLVERKLP